MGSAEQQPSWSVLNFINGASVTEHTHTDCVCTSAIKEENYKAFIGGWYTAKVWGFRVIRDGMFLLTFE